jgi:hypothetical protein
MIVRFGRPVPLMNQVGDGGGAGAAAPSGTPPAGANGQQAPGGDAGGQGSGTTSAGNGQANTQPPPAKTFTQDEVNRIAAQAREDGRRAAAKPPENQEPKKPEPPAGPSAPNVEDLVKLAVSQALQAAGVDPFTQTARAAGYTDAQISLARSAYDPAKAPDLGKWLNEWPTQVGIMIKQGNGTGAPTPAASHGAAPRKVEDLRDEAGLIDVFSLSPEQVMAMGPAQIRTEFEKVLERQRQLSGAPPMPSALRKK